MRKKVLITDLDNTLFDWVEIWFRSFSSMLESIVKISGLDESKLKAEIREVHQRRGTSEYAFLIEEIPSLKANYPDQELAKMFAPSIDAYREARRKWLRLYPTVDQGLRRIKSSGSLVVGYTESMAFYSGYRIRKLGLDGVLDFVYSPPDHDLPKGMSAVELRKYPALQYEFSSTKHRHTPSGELKPNVDILNAILRDVAASKGDCVYLGDSLFKDIAMANDASITSIWAKYGASQHKEEYQLLREVTHWTNADVEREKQISQRQIAPNFTLDCRFDQIFEFIEFEKF